MGPSGRRILKGASVLLFLCAIVAAGFATFGFAVQCASPPPAPPPAQTADTGRLGMGSITMQQVIRDGGEIGWMLIAAVVVVAAVGLRLLAARFARIDAEAEPPPADGEDP